MSDKDEVSYQSLRLHINVVSSALHSDYKTHITHSTSPHACISTLPRNVGQRPTWWPPCRIQMAPSVQRRSLADAHY